MARQIVGDLTYKGKLRRYQISEEPLSSYVGTLASDAQQRVNTTLARTTRGFSTDLVTPIVGKHVEDKAIARATIRNWVLEKAVPSGLKTLDDAEVAQASKVGPLSIMLPFDERREDIYRYYSTPETFGYDIGVLERSLDRVISKFKGNQLNPISIDLAFKEMPKGTNLGGPFFSRSVDYYPQLIDLAKQVEKDGWTRSFDPCMLYWRGQSQGLTSVPKQRTVWGYPHYVSLHELRLQVPVLPILRGLPQFCALVNSDAVNLVVSEMVNMRFKKLSVDFSGFDTTAPSVLSHMAFSVVRHMFKKSAYKLIDYVERAFHSIPLLTPSGVWSGIHTVPSGSVWTNQIDSIIQWILSEYCAEMMGNKLLRSTFQGDDGVWLLQNKWELQEIEALISQFGMTISSDKGGISEDVVFYLQNVHMKEYARGGVYVGVRPLERALAGMLGFETPRDKEWRPIDTTFRWITQAESCRWHPRLDVLAELLVQKDRLIREFNIRELVLLAGGFDEIEARQKARGFPFGKEDLRGVYDFHIIRAIEAYKGVPLSGSRVA